MDPLRPATDADRETAVAALRHHAGAGTIDLDQFGDRTAAVLAARTVAELEAVFTDLPGGAPALAPPPTPHPAPESARVPVHRRGRARTWGRLAPVAPLAVVFVAIWAVTGFGYFWPVWPILGITICALRRRGACWGRRADWDRRAYWV